MTLPAGGSNEEPVESLSAHLSLFVAVPPLPARAE
jgi:hypothetical protein